MSLQIFGLNVEIEIKNEIFQKILEDELSIYPRGDGPCEMRIIVDKESKSQDLTFARNPSSHITFLNGFEYKTFQGTIRFHISSDRKVVHIFPKIRKGLRGKLVKLNNIGYLDDIERIGLFIHENVLVPITFFRKNHFPIHASAIQSPKGSVVLFGGTGGVGKTSLQLNYCMKHDYKFLADDFSILSREGNLFPNLSFPKIYAYNLKNNRQLRAGVINELNFFDKFQWNIKSALQGENKVRRRVDPRLLFNYCNTPQKISHYLILSKDSSRKVYLERIEKSKASKMSLNIVLSEYSSFLNHLNFNNFNSSVLRISTPLSYELLISKYIDGVVSALKDVSTFILHIPKDMQHQEAMDRMISVINETLKI